MRYRPQLASLVTAPPTGAGWVHELKLDGYRIGALVRRGKAELQSRRELDWTARLKAVAAAAAALPCRSALLDGEVCILLPDGRTSFQALQNAFDGGPMTGLTYYVFDLLELEGEDLSGRSLVERKAALERLVAADRSGIVRYSPHFEIEGAELFRRACELGAEGIVSKRANGKHRAGRSEEWLKIKCLKRQEFVIGGFTEPEGKREGIGAMLLGVYEGDALVFCGKVGTGAGFTAPFLREVRRSLEQLEQPECPFRTRPPAAAIGRRPRWVRPALVGEVAFTEWTNEGTLRHPSFQGFRPDKIASDVTREQPREPAAGERVEICGVSISHPERVLDPLPITKLALARYYEGVAEWMLPHVRGRPLTLVRWAEGKPAEKGGVYLHHRKAWGPETLRRIEIREQKKIGEYLVADDAAGLVGLAQMDILEIHTWNSTTEDLEHPDRIVFDLDPDPAVTWPDVVRAARDVRALLEKLGLESWVKTTGGKGLHLAVPLAPEHDWDTCVAFARAVATHLEASEPDRFVATVPKARRRGRILVDYLRNSRGNTSVAAFSTRANPEATASVPLSWAELTPSLTPERFTTETVLQRLRRQKRDPWAAYWDARQRLPLKAE